VNQLDKWFANVYMVISIIPFDSFFPCIWACYGAYSSLPIHEMPVAWKLDGLKCGLIISFLALHGDSATYFVPLERPCRPH